MTLHKAEINKNFLKWNKTKKKKTHNDTNTTNQKPKKKESIPQLLCKHGKCASEIQWPSAMSILHFFFFFFTSLQQHLKLLFFSFHLLSLPEFLPSTARRWAPTVAQCPACLSAGAARGTPAPGPRSRWSHQSSGRSCAPSHEPFRWPPSGPQAEHRQRERRGWLIQNNCTVLYLNFKCT